MEEDKALTNYCRRMISLIRRKQQHLGSAEWELKRRTQRSQWEGEQNTERGRRVGTGDDVCRTRDGGRTSLSLKPRQSPEARTVPAQLISVLRLKALEEDMRRAAEVELHDPAVCTACGQEQASLALKSFIRRKKTQLQFHTLKGRLNTHTGFGVSELKDELERVDWEDLCKISESPPMMPLAGFGRNYSVDICGSQQPGVALETTKERGVALVTDEMRGYPDKNTTGTHLARPRCPFSDR